MTKEFKTHVILTGVCARLEGESTGWIDLTVHCKDDKDRVLR